MVLPAAALNWRHRVTKRVKLPSTWRISSNNYKSSSLLAPAPREEAPLLKKASAAARKLAKLVRLRVRRTCIHLMRRMEERTFSKITQAAHK